MKTITKQITLYSYNELTDKAKEKAMEDNISWYVVIDWKQEEFMPDFVQKAINKCEQLKTPWFFGAYIFEYGEPDLIIELEDRGETFLSTGEVYY